MFPNCVSGRPGLLAVCYRRQGNRCRQGELSRASSGPFLPHQGLLYTEVNICAQGYFLAAFLFLGIVFSLPLCLGVFALALDLPVNTNEALAGLIMPASAYVLMGKGG